MAKEEARYTGGGGEVGLGFNWSTTSSVREVSHLAGPGLKALTKSQEDGSQSHLREEDVPEGRKTLLNPTSQNSLAERIHNMPPMLA